MTYKEKIIVSAYTGYLMCDFEDVHAYIEEKLGRPVYTHELVDEDIQKEIRDRTKIDFLSLCGHRPKDGKDDIRRAIMAFESADECEYFCETAGLPYCMGAIGNLVCKCDGNRAHCDIP